MGQHEIRDLLLWWSHHRTVVFEAIRTRGDLAATLRHLRSHALSGVADEMVWSALDALRREGKLISAEA